MDDSRPGIAEMYTRAVGDGIQRDVVGAMGFAAKRNVQRKGGVSIPGSPLGAAIYRLFAGDSSAAKTIIKELSTRAVGNQASTGRKLDILVAEDLAKSVLAWYRNGVCKPCGGLGQTVIAGTTTLHNICRSCGGTGKIPFESQFTPEHQWVARWMSRKIEVEQERAANLAMLALSDRMDL